ncbi:hypothetical protein Peur_060141 [Populus x canadensis]
MQFKSAFHYLRGVCYLSRDFLCLFILSAASSEIVLEVAFTSSHTTNCCKLAG